MRWFKHFSDAHQHPKIKKLIKIYGPLGYYICFATFEIISKYGGRNLKLSLKKYGISEISEELKANKEEVIRIWEEMFELRLLSKKWFNMGYLYSNKLKDYRDEYTRKPLRKPRHAPDKPLTLASPDTETDTDTDIDKETDTNKRTDDFNNFSYKKEKEKLKDKMAFPK